MAFTQQYGGFANKSSTSSGPPPTPRKRHDQKDQSRELARSLFKSLRRGLWRHLKKSWKTQLKRVVIGGPLLLAAWLLLDIDIQLNDRQTIARRAALLGGLGLTPYLVYSHTPPLVALADKVALRHGLDPLLFRALISQESGWNPNALSSKGAAGLTQLMPATALEVCNLQPEQRFEPEKNLDCGARYLARQIRRFEAVDLALAAYNAGPERVARLGRIPRISETENYVSRILVTWNGGST